MMSSGNSNCIRYCITICLSLAFLAVGLFIALIGPTLPTLAYNLHVDIDSISYVLTARGFGYLIGTIISGLIYKKFNIHRMMFVTLLVTAIGSVSAPLVNHVELLAMSLFTAGFAMGFLDTAGNVLCLQTWGEKSGPFMQTLHFSFAVGTTLSPVVAMPFIMNANVTNAPNVSRSNLHLNSTSGIKSLSENPSLNKHFAVVYAFVICAAFCAIIAICFLFLSFYHNNQSTSDQKNTIQKEGKIFRFKMLVLLYLFFLLYVGAEVTFGVYIYTFAIKSAKHYSKSIATGLNSLFWGSFAVGRFIAIFLSKWFQPSQLLKGDLLGTLIAVIILVCFPYYYQQADILLWIAVIIYGFSMASIFPTGVSWAEEYITVNEKAAMILVVGASTGEMVLPFAIGQFIELNPVNLFYFCFIAAILSTMVLFIMFRLANSKGKRLNVNHGSNRNRANEMEFLIESSSEDDL